MQISQPAQHIEVPRHRLAYRRFGQGPDLVFVHGWPLTSATFRASVPLFAPRFTCHLVDLPGSGESESEPGAPCDFASLATVLRAAIDRLGLSRYALFAHDSGGLIARLIAADDRRVTALVSGDTEIPGHTPTVIKALLAAAKLPGGAELLRLAMKRRIVRRSPLGYGGCFHDLDFIDGEFHRLLVEPLLSSPTAWEKQLAIIRTIDHRLHRQMREAHAKIAAPVLFVWGADDTIFPLEKARAMVPELERAELVVIDGARAFVHEEKPAEFAAQALPFLARAFAA